MLEEIWSGGQTGADLSALSAANYVGLKTGGWMPKGFRNNNGNHPEYEQKYNLKEHSSKSYYPRTMLNVAQTDGTIRIAGDFNSAGEVLTLKYIKKFKKPYLDIPVELSEEIGELTIDVKHFDLAAEWIIKNNIKKLNVAGNSESTCSGIGLVSSKFLIDLFHVKLNIWKN